MPFGNYTGPFSVLIVFPATIKSLCLENENPKIYVSTGTNITVLVGILQIPLKDFSLKNFEFQLNVDIDIIEVKTTLKGKYHFHSEY
jgi:hypothetical protein